MYHDLNTGPVSSFRYLSSKTDHKLNSVCKAEK